MTESGYLEPSFNKNITEYTYTHTYYPEEGLPSITMSIAPTDSRATVATEVYNASTGAKVRVNPDYVNGKSIRYGMKNTGGTTGATGTQPPFYFRIIVSDGVDEKVYTINVPTQY